MTRVTFFFICIVIIAAALRLWGLGTVPASPDWDEVALGYNAVSILQTGKDEYGNFFPVVLRSFDDYKPALYAYFVIPFIQLFGLSVFTVRLPSALFGIFTVAATFFLVKELFGTKKLTLMGKEIDANYLALLASFLLAISPWHIQFSRIAFESNVGIAFNVFAFLFFLKGLKKAPYLILSVFLATLNIYIYQSEKVFTPLMLLALIVIYRKELFKISKKWIAAALMVALIVAIPMILYTLTDKNALLRAQGVSIFSDQQLVKQNAEKLVIDKENNNVFGQILDNRRIEFTKQIVYGYISHFDLNWLFINGDIARHHAPNMGLLYLVELPFIFIGMYQLLFGKFDRKIRLAIFAYFLIVPIPASITTGVPHAVRTLNFLPVYQVFIALGFITAYIFVMENKMMRRIPFSRYTIVGVVGILGLFNFLYYLNQYFVQQNYYTSQDWQYGYEEAISYIQPTLSQYSKIIVSNERPLDQSYMFFLFYVKYPPAEYQRESREASGGFAETHAFGKFEFRPIAWSSEKRDSSILYIGRAQDFPAGVKKLKTVRYLNGEEVISIVEGQ